MITIRHIDTCLSCYLTDHHTRPGEFLVGVPVDGNSTLRDVRDMLLDEIDMFDVEGLPEPREVERAVAEAFHGFTMEKKFDPTLDVIDEEDYDAGREDCFAWFLLEWEQAD